MKKNIGCRVTLITLLVCALLIAVSFSAVAFSNLDPYISIEKSTDIEDVVDVNEERPVEELESLDTSVNIDIEHEEIEDDDTETQPGSQRINRLELPNIVEEIDEVYIDPPEEEGDIQTPGTVTYVNNPYDSSVSADYLILTSDEFFNSNSLEDLAEHRASYNGFDVAVVSIDDIYGGNNQNRIKNYIEFVMQSWDAPHMENNHLGYLLIVGDTEHVDSSHHFDDVNDKWYVSDLWYGCFQDIGNGQYEGDDDYSTIDIKIGRFCVDNQDELNVIADKTIQYELNPTPGDWHKQVLMARGQYDEPSWYQFVKENLLELGSWDVFEVFKREGGSASQVVSNINNGRKIVVYCGHGDVSYWVDLGFSMSQLRNSDKLPIIFSMACLTGTFQGDADCMGEILLNTPNKGAIAFFGASNTTSEGAFWFANELFVSMFENFEYTLGDIIVEGFAQMDNFPLFNLFGDPALDISGSTGHPDKSDLAISHKGITISPENPTTEDDQITISAIIHNIGGGTAEDVDVRFISVNSNGVQQIIGDQTIDEIISGTTSTATQQWDISQKIGKYTIIVQVDSQDNIDEAYELNNQAGININIPLEVVYVDDDFNSSTPGWGTTHFSKIGTAISKVMPHGTVKVSPGTYNECIVINKPLKLLGEDKTSTIISGEKCRCLMVMPYESIYVGKTGDDKSGQKIPMFGNGKPVVTIQSTNNVVLSGFTITKTRRNNAGIFINRSSENTIAGNWIKDVGGIGISLVRSSRNMIFGNFINGTSTGVKLDSISIKNSIYYNIFGNNNTNHAASSGNNFWNYSYPFGGNMWSGHDNHDEYSGPNQDEVGSDGIVDQPGGGLNPYTISDGNVDNYPRNDLNYNQDYQIFDIHGPYNGGVRERIFFSSDVFGSNSPYEILWDFGDGDTSDDQNPTYVYDSPGEYLVTLSITDRFGATTLVNTTVTITADDIPPVYNVDEDVYYRKIQDAVSFASLGNTIQVASGIYQENVVIETSINLIGENKDTTIIDGGGTGTVVKLNAPSSLITGFTIRNSGSGSNSGFSIASSDNTIEDNIILDNYNGISIQSSFNSILNNQILSNAGVGIRLMNAADNSISQNIISDNGKGLYLFASKLCSQESCNPGSNDNLIVENLLENNLFGIYIADLGSFYNPCDNNMIYHNNFIDNTQNAYDNCENYWDDSISEGNYWDDWSGSGSYIIEPGDNQDNYPLTDPW